MNDKNDSLLPRVIRLAIIFITKSWSYCLYLITSYFYLFILLFRILYKVGPIFTICLILAFMEKLKLQ